MASPHEASSVEDLLEDSFDVRFYIIQNTNSTDPALPVTIAFSVFESPFILSCQELLQDVPGFLRTALSHYLDDEDIHFLASQITSYAQSRRHYYQPLNTLRTQTTHHHRLIPLFVNIQLAAPPYEEEDDDEDPDMIIITDKVIQQSMQQLSMVPASENAIASLIKKDEVINLRLDETERCSIYLENFEDDDCVLGLPCEHVYHKDCIVQWLNTSHMCPLCRFKMPVK